MEIQNIEGSTRAMKPPADWDEEKQGPCGTLPILDQEIDGNRWMTSAWALSVEEIANHSAGAPLYLSIRGTDHPVVSLHVGEQPEEAPPRSVAMQIAMEFAQSIDARIAAHVAVSPEKRLCISPLQHHGSGSFVTYGTLEPGELVPNDCKGWRILGPFPDARS